ncbi:hypothetical protein EON64_13455 [archaeon]|nr:MAG: hypothetical protein EON64_13455 [archaeon]
MNPEDLADFFGKDESKVPFEYLDPCCQQEILEKRYYNEVSDRLRRDDRSQARNDAKQSVLSKLGLGSIQCGCCKTNEDYASLRKLRKQLEEKAQTGASTDYEETSDLRDDDNDDDDDSLLDIDIPLTPAELARMAAIAEQMRRREMAEQSELLLGKHVEESLLHVLTIIKKVPNLPVLLHVYEDDAFNAMMDIVFEELAGRYLGSWCRRIPCTQILPYDDSAYKDIDHQVIEDLNTLLMEDRTGILLIRQGRVVRTIRSRDLESVGDSLELIRAHLSNMLAHSNMLEEDLPSVLFKLPQILVEERDKVEDADEETYCEDPGCLKRYPHEHVQAGASFLLSDRKDDGSKVFAEGSRQSL